MEREKIDPAFIYTDKKSAELLKELKKLHKSILQTQRFLALLSVRVTHNESTRYTEAYGKASSEFASQITAAFLKIDTSKEPLTIATQFSKKRWNDLQELGVKTLRIGT